MRQNASKSRLMWWMLMSALLLVGMLVFTAGPIGADDGDSTLLENPCRIKIKGSGEGELGASLFSSLDADNIIFEQPPTSPYHGATLTAYASDAGLGYLGLEDFWGLTSAIDDIHWYGFALILDDMEVYEGDPSGMQFDIIFYQDNEGSPGAKVAEFANISPDYEAYNDYVFTAYRFDVASLEAPVSLTEGWLSIQSTYSPSGSTFFWFDSPSGNLNAIMQYDDDTYPCDNNLSFALTSSPVITVGGEVYPENRVGIIAPWLALALVIATGGILLVTRRAFTSR
ncbi:hypothetical protein ACFLXT_03280 [Chloroflexota bacterium]